MLGKWQLFLSTRMLNKKSKKWRFGKIWKKQAPRTAKVGAKSKAQKVQNFQNMLMTFYEKLTKKFHPKEAFCAGKTLQKFGYSGWDKCEHLFSNLRLLLSETEYTSEITSKIRIKRFTPDITFKFRILKKNIGGYVLRKPNVR